MVSKAEAFSISVIDTKNSFLIEQSWEGLYVSVHGRLVDENGILLDSKELAEQYKDAITARRIKAGDKEFESEVVDVTHLLSQPKFSEKTKYDSEVIRAKLEKWKYPTPQNITVNDNGWIISVQIEERFWYLGKLGKDGSMKVCTHKSGAKIYKLESFVQKALKEINSHPKHRAVASLI
jgi:hypothetical protein